MMGTHYQRGESYAINHQKALDYFIRTVLAGNTIGFWGLGEAYKNGWGIEKNYLKAYICYQKCY